MKYPTLIVSLGVVLSLGCEGTASSDASASGDKSCAARSATACALDGACVVVTGVRYDAEAGCSYGASNVGCQEPGCDDGAFTFAKSPAGSTYRFPTGCNPEGWEAFDGTPEDNAAADGPICGAASGGAGNGDGSGTGDGTGTGGGTDSGSCAEQSPEDCNAETCATLTGTQYDTENTCVHTPEAVGCGEKADCGDGAIAFAKDSEGRPWFFPTTCIPSDFTRVDAPGADDQAALGWDACD